MKSYLSALQSIQIYRYHVAGPFALVGGRSIWPPSDLASGQGWTHSTRLTRLDVPARSAAHAGRQEEQHQRDEAGPGDGKRNNTHQH